ncbi:acetyl-coenzyme A transporter 1-domain-containing protein [Phakopsora pachyrhizi]|uniref:Acetyl-coenzyme A transporter 1-domain-containing protein n=1 Tax=Phakopsora pachyrhizi TaxID=170000 RepID=A0AAV0ADR1_PHAPC|nr:acetyl-coenzyme A transporter 1-domain-containing protein [Phakopsora pachyrhizi]
MSSLSHNRFAVLDSNDDIQPQGKISSPNSKKKKSKANLKSSDQISGSTTSLMAANEPNQQAFAGLRTRTNLPGPKDRDDLLERGEDESSSKSSQRTLINEKPVSRKGSKNSIKKSERSVKVQPENHCAPNGAPLTMKDKQAMALLVVLYMLQGIPCGLAFGSIPFLLRARLSYSQIGLFSLATYPYSIKLFWSPIVDSCYFTKIGRRKSWIMPVQALVGVTLYWLGNSVDALMEAKVPDVKTLTALFFTLVLFAATQDIAVDGWALELLSKDNLSYASTAQTVGLNIGYFLSFTVFLAFNSIEFSNNRWRALFGLVPQDYPVMTLSGYLKFGGACFILVTLYLAFIQSEDSVDESSEESSMGIKEVYQIMMQICSLKHVQLFIFLHLIAKFGFSVNDAATSLKLMEKGLSKEDMALSWSSGDKPLKPWIWAMWFRLAFSALSVGLVYFFPTSKPLSNWYFFLVIASTVMTSSASTAQMVGVTAFHTQIADPMIGGTYMTLLNTVSNLGGTWPKYFVLKGVDYFTEAACLISNPNSTQALLNGQLLDCKECVTDIGKAQCIDLAGNCNTSKDGYYFMQAFCITAGALLLLFVVQPTSRKLESLPSKAWHVRKLSKS